MFIKLFMSYFVITCENNFSKLRSILYTELQSNVILNETE